MWPQSGFGSSFAFLAALFAALLAALQRPVDALVLRGPAAPQERSRSFRVPPPPPWRRRYVGSGSTPWRRAGVRFLRQRRASRGHRTRPPDFERSPEGNDPLCKETAKMGSADYYRPIVEVMREHPGTDPMCYFGSDGSLDDWMMRCYRASRAGDWTLMPLIGRRLDQNHPSYINDLVYRPTLHQTINFTYDGGRNFVTNNDEYFLDDFYCHAMRWMELPSESVSDFEGLQEMAMNECDWLAQKYPGWENWTMLGHDVPGSSQEGTVPDVSEPWGYEETRLMRSRYGGRTPSARTAEMHAMFKCVLGNLACDMAFCALNFCQLDTGYIGHAAECSDDIEAGRLQDRGMRAAPSGGLPKGVQKVDKQLPIYMQALW